MKGLVSTAIYVETWSTTLFTLVRQEVKPVPVPERNNAVVDLASEEVRLVRHYARINNMHLNTATDETAVITREKSYRSVCSKMDESGKRNCTVDNNDYNVVPVSLQLDESISTWSRSDDEPGGLGTRSIKTKPFV